MGSCTSKNVSTGARASKKIDTALDLLHQEERERIRVLLLGAGESGKSTIFKQVRIIHDKGYSAHDRRETFAPIIHHNVVSNMKGLINACDRHGLELPEHLKGPAAELQKEVELSQLCELTPELATTIEQLWMCDSIQRAFQELRDTHAVADSASYFFDNLDRLSASDYTPSDQDILQARWRTTGITRGHFNLESVNIELVDVGGQRNERRKWIHCFDDVDTVLFVASLSDYDSSMYEAQDVNRMQESLNLFAEICNSRFFRDTSMLLFLNKKDLFAEKIKSTNITTAFPDYDGPQKFGPAVEYIRDQFLAQNERPERSVFTHVTCATDTNQIAVVLSTVKEIMLADSLRMSGFV